MERFEFTYTFFAEGGGCKCEVSRGPQRGEALGFWGGTDEATEAAMLRAGLATDWLKHAPIDVTVHDQRTGETKRYHQEPKGEAHDGSHDDCPLCHGEGGHPISDRDTGYDWQDCPACHPTPVDEPPF